MGPPCRVGAEGAGPSPLELLAPPMTFRPPAEKLARAKLEEVELQLSSGRNLAVNDG